MVWGGATRQTSVSLHPDGFCIARNPHCCRIYTAQFMLQKLLNRTFPFAFYILAFAFSYALHCISSHCTQTNAQFLLGLIIPFITTSMIVLHFLALQYNSPRLLICAFNAQVYRNKYHRQMKTGWDLSKEHAKNEELRKS